MAGLQALNLGILVRIQAPEPKKPNICWVFLFTYQNRDDIIYLYIISIYMKAKTKEKYLAIKLRKQGLSYSEIKEKIPVSQATLSLWLKSVILSEVHTKRLEDRIKKGQIKGAKMRRQKRISDTQEIYRAAKQDIGRISRRELWLMGTALYWAEGTKAKSYRPSCGLIFSNSDPEMIRVFLKWLTDVCEVPLQKIKFEIYIHKNHESRINAVKKYWAEATSFSLHLFQHVYFKRQNLMTVRKNIDESYFGVVRIKVKESTNLNRKISGWIIGVNDYLFSKG